MPILNSRTPSSDLPAAVVSEVSATQTTGLGVTNRRALRLAWWTFAAWVAMVIATIVLSLATKPIPRATIDPTSVGNIFLLVLTATFPIVAIFILARQPTNRIGWVLMAIGILWNLPFESYGLFAISRDLPAGYAFVALSSPTWAPPIVLMGTSLLLRFPDGEFLSHRWRWVERLALGTLIFTVAGILLSPGNLGESGFPHVENPFGLDSLKTFFDIAQVVLPILPLTIIASAVSLVLRFRRSSGTERLQLKWLASAGAVVAALYLVAMLASIPFTWGAGAPTLVSIIQNASLASFALIPIAIGIAILKYRLYDINLVISKTLAYGAMAAFVTAVYVGIVVGIGHVIGSDNNLALSIFATALVAVAFQPVRERVQRYANRLVYGKRATPYEVLSKFSGGMSHTIATEDLLPRMAQIVAEGTGATSADIWLHVGSDLVREASWPRSNGDGSMTIPSTEGSVSIPGADAVVPVRHQGDLLGMIGITKAAGDAVRPEEQKLLEDLSSQAGLVLRNVRLIEEVKASRQRLVTAQDDERRRLERDLHDGAQQRLVAISLALRMASRMVDPEADSKLANQLELASDELGRALSELREFARGIHPAILTERGLVPALELLAERFGIPTTVHAQPIDRLPKTVEATAYFVVSEALSNVGKYAEASRVDITVSKTDDALTVEVADDGIGGADPSKGSGLSGLDDRVAAVDGSLRVDSPDGQGTRLTFIAPIRMLTAAQ